jgi:hypothetical protein
MDPEYQKLLELLQTNKSNPSPKKQSTNSSPKKVEFKQVAQQRRKQSVKTEEEDKGISVGTFQSSTNLPIKNSQVESTKDHFRRLKAYENDTFN